MNTMKKIAYSILASVFVFANENAGELSVTGSAKATYTILSVDGSPTDDIAGKGIGIANEFSLGASGELDNGWTWSMNQDIDGVLIHQIAFGNIFVRTADPCTPVVTVVKVRLHQRLVAGGGITNSASRRRGEWIH